jgi:hypothetical protein
MSSPVCLLFCHLHESLLYGPGFDDRASTENSADVSDGGEIMAEIAPLSLLGFLQIAGDATVWISFNPATI